MTLAFRSGLMALLLLAANGCSRQPVTAMLVAEYSEGSTTTLFRARVPVPSAEDDYRFNFALQNGKKTCTLIGALDAPPPAGECAGASGRGTITCNDGKPMKLRWTLSSCRSGSGRSIGKGKTRFLFGYAHNKERAQDQLDRIRKEAR